MLPELFLKVCTQAEFCKRREEGLWSYVNIEKDAIHIVNIAFTNYTIVTFRDPSVILQEGPIILKLAILEANTIKLLAKLPLGWLKKLGLPILIKEVSQNAK